MSEQIGYFDSGNPFHRAPTTIDGQPNPFQRSVADLVAECHVQIADPGTKNKNRALLIQCVAAVSELAMRLHKAEQPRPVVYETPDEPVESHGEAV